MAALPAALGGLAEDGVEAGQEQEDAEGLLQHGYVHGCGQKGTQRRRGKPPRDGGAQEGGVQETVFSVLRHGHGRRGEKIEEVHALGGDLIHA